MHTPKEKHLHAMHTNHSALLSMLEPVEGIAKLPKQLSTSGFNFYSKFEVTMNVPDGKGQPKEKRFEAIVINQWADRASSVQSFVSGQLFTMTNFKALFTLGGMQTLTFFALCAMILVGHKFCRGVNAATSARVGAIQEKMWATDEAARAGGFNHTDHMGYLEYACY